MDKEKLTFLLLRMGLSFVFLYAAASSTLNPDNWIGYFPPFIKSILPQNLLLPLFSLYELVLALWILSGRKLFYSSTLSSFTLLGIIVFNLNQMDVIFRDISILLTSVALAVYSYPGKLKS